MKQLTALIMFFLLYLLVSRTIDLTHDSLFKVSMFVGFAQLCFIVSMDLINLIADQRTKTWLMASKGGGDKYIIFLAIFCSSLAIGIMSKFDVNILILVAGPIGIWGLIIFIFGSIRLKKWFFWFSE